MNRLTTSLLAVLLFTAVACGKKDDKAAAPAPTAPVAGETAAKPVAGEPAAPAAAPAAATTAPAAPAAPAAAPAAAVKSEYKPDEIWTTISGMSRLDIMEKFADGVTVTGAATKVLVPEGGEYGIELDAGSNHIVELRFADFGKIAKEKGIKAGDTVAATKCQITNPEGDRMALVGCELK